MLRKFNDDTRSIAVGLLGILVLAAWAYVVLTQKHDPPKGQPPRAISGVRAGAYPQDWRRVLRQILTPTDLWELNHQLGRTMRGQIYFFLQTTLDYKSTVETQTPHKTESGKRFWVEGQDG